MSELAQAADDRRWMMQAVAMAALGEGTTSPNPRVGCVIVRDGKVVGRGYHRYPGGDHAEAIALGMAGDAARGATLYVNLEPCNHHGKTPPCCDRILSMGIRRVVAGTGDPNPRVNGSGFRRLRQAGLEVVEGVLEEAAVEVNRPFLQWFNSGRPYVSLKAAVSSDGRISGLQGKSRWITGETSRRFAHRLRFRHDAVLVGANTVRRDDPRLDARLPGVRAAGKLRVVLAPTLDLDPGARLFRNGGSGSALPRIYVSADLPAVKEEPFSGRADIIRVRAEAGVLDLDAVLEDLGSYGVQSVMVEGGARTLAGFLEAGLAQCAYLFLAPVLIGNRGGTPALDMRAVAEPALGWRLEEIRRIALGRDTLIRGRLARPL